MLPTVLLTCNLTFECEGLARSSGLTRPRPRILQEEHYRFIDDTMAENMDLTGRQLFALFEEKFTTVDVSLSTIKHARLELGWVSKQAKYRHRVTTNDLEMNHVIFTDESTVQIEGHRKVIFHKQGQPMKLVARPKHPQ